MSFSFIYEDEEESPEDKEFRDYLYEGMGSMGGGGLKELFDWRVIFLSILLFFGVVAVVAICFFLAWFAIRFDPNSFWQSLFITISAGICLFLLNGIFVLYGAKTKKALAILLITLSLASGTIAYYSKGILQAYLINLAVGFLLVLGLELLFLTWLKRINDKIKEKHTVPEPIESSPVWPPGGGPSAVIKQGD